MYCSGEKRVYQDNFIAIVADEAHCVEQWLDVQYLAIFVIVSDAFLLCLHICLQGRELPRGI